LLKLGFTAPLKVRYSVTYARSALTVLLF